MPVLTRRHLMSTAASAVVIAALAGKGHAGTVPSFDGLLFDLMAHDPEAAVYAGFSEGQVGVPLLNRFNDYSPGAENANRRRFQKARYAIRAMPKSADRDVIGTVFDTVLASADIGYGVVNPLSYAGHSPFIINQISGPAIGSINLMTALQPVKTMGEVQAYLEKLADAPRAFSGIADKIRYDSALGCVLPARLLPNTLAVIDRGISTPASDNPLVTSFRARLDAAGYQPSQVDELSNKAAKRVERYVIPAFQSIRDALADVAPKARKADGIWSQPEGERFYAAQVLNLGGSTRSPEEIYRIGLEDVKRIIDEMDGLLQKKGYLHGSVGTRITSLSQENGLFYPDSDAGRASLLKSVRQQMDTMERRLPELFHKATIPSRKLEVRRVPAETQASAPMGYYDAPSLDGTRAAIYWINLGDMSVMSRLKLPTLGCHEAMPGHHLQVSVAMDQGARPLMRNIVGFNAYAEGWALYGERLAAEMGLYDDDPVGDLGRLRDELLCSVCLVIDTGLHHKRWNGEKAIAYGQEVTGYSHARMVSEIERYMAWPGQALGYKLGMLRILELRDETRRRLGHRFDIRNFHDAVLKGGSVPLAVLDRQVAALG